MEIIVGNAATLLREKYILTFVDCDLPHYVNTIATNENNIEYIQITLSDPRRYLTRDGFAIAPQGENSKRNYDVDISPLKNCKQIRSLTLEGNIIHSEVLEELPNLQILALDNTLGNTVIDVSKLHGCRLV